MFAKQYSEVFAGDATWNGIKVPQGDRYAWDGGSTYIKRAPYFDSMADPKTSVRNMSGMRALAMLGDSVTTDHISPAGNIAKNSPAGEYLISLGVKPGDFNSYGARRGNHEVMDAGRWRTSGLRNQMAPGTEGGWTSHVPSKDQMTIFDAAIALSVGGRTAGDHRGEGVRLGLVARLGREGRAAVGRARGDRRELRANSPIESRLGWAFCRSSLSTGRHAKAWD
jgi:aconitate hydratase